MTGLNYDLFVKPCRKCKAPRERTPSGAYHCRPCRSHYKRARRAVHLETRLKEQVRAFSNVYVKRKRLKRLPCEFCGDKKAEMHHWDYTRPLDVTWLCKICHALIEQSKRIVAADLKEAA